MNTDNPIKLKEEDLLDRYIFAKNIVKILFNGYSNGQNSIVYGINGEWGSGKSSFLTNKLRIF